MTKNIPNHSNLHGAQYQKNLELFLISIKIDKTFKFSKDDFVIVLIFKTCPSRSTGPENLDSGKQLNFG